MYLWILKYNFISYYQKETTKKILPKRNNKEEMEKRKTVNFVKKAGCRNRIL